MKVKLIVFLILFLFKSNCFALDKVNMGLCDLDRTVDSYDPTSWLTAKSRASRDIVPIKFNENVLYLGYGNDSNVYTIKEKLNKNNSSAILNLYGYSDGTSILVSSTENKTIIIFSASEIGPLLLGICEMKKL